MTLQQAAYPLVGTPGMAIQQDAVNSNVSFELMAEPALLSKRQEMV